MYVNYLFASNALQRDKDDAKWTAFLLTSLFFSMIICLLICFIGLLFGGIISEFLNQNDSLFWFSIYLISPILLAMRYYLNKEKLDLILNNLSRKSERRIKLIRKFIYIIMILIPVLSFCVYRLCMFGQIKWW